MSPRTPPRILIIAGSDSSGGAGIQADIKTVTMLGGHAMTAITAITAQNTVGVQAVQVLDADLVIAQARSCIDDIGVDAVKIGMLGSPAIADAVADMLETMAVPVVFDPVMVATSGSVLADPETISAFERLIGIATVVTPNVPELAALGGAAALRAGKVTFLAKGGDAPGPVVTDTLYRPGEEPLSWSAPRIATRHTHGTGCTLGSAIANGLGSGLSLLDAVERGRAFTRAAIEAAPGLGSGSGPLGHQAVRGVS